MHRKFWLAAVGVVVGSLMTAAPAFAHDCFIVNRSDTSSTQVGLHSKVWTTVFSLYDALVAPPTDPPSDDGGLGLSPECANLVLDAVHAAHLPTVFATRNDKTIGENSQNPNLANGKGLEHFDETDLFNQILQVVFTVPCVQQP